MYSNQYYDARNSAGYSGARHLIRINKKRNPIENKEEKKRIYKWLSNQDAYTLHKPVRRKFDRLYYSPSGIDQVWELDLAVLPNLQKYNDGFAYIFGVIDILSKFVWVEPLRDKKMITITKAFEKILKRSNGRRPDMIQTDSGSEFVNKEFNVFLNKKGIKFRTTKNEVKAACIERFFRTLKERMWRYFTYKNTKRYVGVLQDLVNSYNSTKHSTTKMLPKEVNIWNAAQARKNMISKFKNRKIEKSPKYTVGDFVRVSRAKFLFEKGYEQNWSEEVFKVSRVLRRQNIYIYELQDLEDELIDGFFYKQELNLVGKDRMRKNQQFLIRDVLKSRGRGNNKELLVSWVGYPKKFNSWIKASALENL